MCRGQSTTAQSCQNTDPATVELATQCDGVLESQRCSEADGLVAWMESLGLAEYSDAAMRFCEDRGGMAVADVLANWEEFVNSLALKPLEVRRIEKYVTEQNGVSATTQATEIQVKWGKRCLSVTAITMGDLRAEIERQTGILPAKQKLMGAKVKLDDDRVALAALKICKPLMLVGTPEAEFSNSTLAGRDARVENESREDSPVFAKCARRSKVCFQSTVAVADLDGSESVASFESAAMLPATDKDTRKSYAKLDPGRIVPPGTLYAQEERAALPEPAIYDPQEPQVLLAMVWSGVYKIMGSKRRGLATSYMRAAAGGEAWSQAAESSRRKYWQQFEQELKPILSKGCSDTDWQI